MPQTSINLRQPKWLGEGQYATTNSRNVDGAVANALYDPTATTPLPYGRIAVLTPSTGIITALTGSAPSAGTLLVLPVWTDRYGLPFSTLTKQFTPAQLAAGGNLAEDAIGYPPNSYVEYATEGDFIMWSETAANIGDAVYYRMTSSGGNTVLGRITKTQDGTAANTPALPTLRYAETITAAGLVAVRVTASFGLAAL